MRSRTLQNVQLLLVVVTCTCESFKLPLKVRKSENGPWRELQLHSEEDLPTDINSISSAPGKDLKYPIGDSEVTDFAKQEMTGNGAFYPVVISLRRGDLDGGYVEETSSGHLKYEEMKPQLERFYKKSTRSQPNGDGVILFPTEEPETTMRPEFSPEDVLRFGPESQPSPDKDDLSIPTSESAASSDEVRSLEALAHIVRQLLFRGSADRSRETVTEVHPVQQAGQDGTSTPGVDWMYLYSGPRIKPGSSGDSEICADGLKKTRNGFCQKPSRRLGTG